MALGETIEPSLSLFTEEQKADDRLAHDLRDSSRKSGNLDEVTVDNK